MVNIQKGFLFRRVAPSVREEKGTGMGNIA